MPAASEYLSAPTVFTGLIIGPEKSGKSDLALTFPRVYAITCDPLGLEFLKNRSPRSQEMAKNLVWLEQFNVETGSISQDAFRYVSAGELEPESGVKSIYHWLNHARSMSSEWDTLLFDGFTYFVNMLEQFYLRPDTADTQRAWGQMKLYLNQLVRADILSFASLGKHVIFTAHVRRLSEEQLEGTVNKKTLKRSKAQVDQTSDIRPAVDGSFRDEMGGLFSCIAYLEARPGKPRILKDKEGKEIQLDTEERWAHTGRIEGYLGSQETVVNGGNRHGFPLRLNLTDRYFYRDIFLKYTERKEAAR